MTWIQEAPSNKGTIIKSMSINNDAMEAVANLNAKVTFGSSALTRVQEEAIATTVAAANHCRY
jgi:alkylhydroperoxidase family enzyme